MASNSFFSAPRNRSSSVPSCRWPVASPSDHRLSLRTACSHSGIRPTSRRVPLLALPSRYPRAFATRVHVTPATGVCAKSLAGLSHQLPARQAWPFAVAHRIASASSHRGCLSRFHCAARANHSFQGTVGKLRLPIPSALRASAAPELGR